MTRYAPSYCEENVWWLARELPDPEAAEVAFVSNRARTVALFEQRAARRPGEPVVWDYHVVLALRGPSGVEVHDLDCTLGTPLPAARWLDASFREGVRPDHRPRFRVLGASEYLALLASDRSHMKRRDGRWLVPPPPWPPIGSGPSNLMRLVDLDDPIAGDVVDLAGLRSRWR